MTVPGSICTNGRHTGRSCDPDDMRAFSWRARALAPPGPGAPDRDDVATALENLQEIYDYVVNDRVPL